MTMPPLATVVTAVLQVADNAAHLELSLPPSPPPSRRRIPITRTAPATTIPRRATKLDFDDNSSSTPSLISPSSTLSTTTTSTTHRKKSVTFAPLIQIRNTLSRRDYTNREAQSTWLSVSELYEIKIAYKRIVSQLDSGDSLTSIKDSIRGLEHKTDYATRQRLRNRSAAASAVFDEQEAQRGEGIVDSEIIACSYSYYTAQSRANAFSIALQDAKVAVEQYEHEGSDRAPSDEELSLTTMLCDDMYWAPLYTPQSDPLCSRGICRAA